MSTDPTVDFATAYNSGRRFRRVPGLREIPGSDTFTYRRGAEYVSAHAGEVPLYVAVGRFELEPVVVPMLDRYAVLRAAGGEIVATHATRAGIESHFAYYAARAGTSYYRIAEITEVK